MSLDAHAMNHEKFGLQLIIEMNLQILDLKLKFLNFSSKMSKKKDEKEDMKRQCNLHEVKK